MGLHHLLARGFDLVPSFADLGDDVAEVRNRQTRAMHNF
jgi:hypothetical protein